MDGKPIKIKNSLPIFKQWYLKNSERKISIVTYININNNNIIRVHLTRDTLKWYENINLWFIIWHTVYNWEIATILNE